MGGTRDGQSTGASRERAEDTRPATDRWLRAAGMLLAVAAVACALAGAFHSTSGASHGAVGLSVTLCACAMLVAWAFAPIAPPVGRDMSRPYTNAEREWRPEPGEGTDNAPLPVLPLAADSAPPTFTIARPAGDWQPLAAPPRPLYALDELTAAEPADVRQSPYLDDPLFRLEDPGPDGWLARMGKDPTQLCQDSFACNPTRRVYAVTDGVSQSFMPAAWARIVARAAVSHPDPFGGEAEFAAWLDAAADRWRAWMREVWVPRAAVRDWSDAIDGQGAQTTLVCCVIGGRAQRGTERTVRVDVTAIGDAECLLFRQAADRWELVAAFPLEHPSDFGARPATLATRRDPARVAAMYRSLRRGSFEAHPGDRLALATDAVACWLLTQARRHSVSPSVSSVPSVVSPSASADEDPIALALSDPAAFERLAQVEIDAGRLEDDDLTLLVIPIP